MNKQKKIQVVQLLRFIYDNELIFNNKLKQKTKNILKQLDVLFNLTDDEKRN